MQDVRVKTYPASKALLERARKSLAGGVSSQFRMFTSPHPMFYRRAAGSHIWDADGNELIDFTLAQGPLILGHSHPEVLRRVNEAIDDGQLFAGQFEQEVLLAEKLQQLIPAAERVRFSSSGSEAAHAVLRLARYATGKPKFIKFEGHYHGWFDSVSISVNPPAATPVGDPLPWGGGIPESVREDVVVLPWNDLEQVERTLHERGDEIGAIITEPIMANQGCIEPAPGYLAGLRDLCDRHNVALIFDEIITGFRVDLGGVQRRYGVTPDLAIFGKALASGFPLSAIVGLERFMAPLEQSEVYHAGTLNANNASVAAALATVELLEHDDEALFHRLAETGSTLRESLPRARPETRPSPADPGAGPDVSPRLYRAERDPRLPRHPRLRRRPLRRVLHLDAGAGGATHRPRHVVRFGRPQRRRCRTQPRRRRHRPRHADMSTGPQGWGFTPSPALPLKGGGSYKHS